MVEFVSRFNSYSIFRKPAIGCLILSALMFGTADCVPIDAQVSPYHLDETHLERIDSALGIAVEWLVSHQREDGAFQSEMVDGVPPLPLTAMALWALSEAGGAQTHPENCWAAATYLLSFQQEDGGIYEPQQGLVRYTAAVARQGLEAWRNARKDTPPHDDAGWRQAMERLNLFVYRHRNLESLADEEVRSTPGQITADVEKLLQQEDLPEDLKQPLRFLLEASQKPTDGMPHHLLKPKSQEFQQNSPVVMYDVLLRYIGEFARADNPTVWRAYQAIRANYTLKENPDLTKRYGPDGFGKENASTGLYYYYLTLARTLGTVGRPELKTLDGQNHDWANELSSCLLERQKSEGFWVNDNKRWFESDSVLVTCYAMISLSICRDAKGQRK